MLPSDAHPLHLANEILNDPRRWLHLARAESGLPLIGHFCRLTPEPLIRAMGATPVQLAEMPAGLDPRVDLHIQSYSCRVLRLALSWALTARDVLDAVVVPHTCDAMQCLPDLWRAASPIPVLALQLPTTPAAPAARGYLRAELQRFAADLGALSKVRLKDDRLAAELAFEDMQSTAWQRLYDFQRTAAPGFAAADFYAVVLASQRLPAADRLALCEQTLAFGQHRPAEKPPTAKSAPRIVLGGGPLLDLAVPRAIDEIGGLVVADDLCTGERRFESLALRAAPSSDPLDRLADHILQRPVCPAHHRPGEHPGLRLCQRVRQSSAQGIVYLQQKFCEPYAFDLPAVRQALQDGPGDPVPLLVCELDPAGPAGTGSSAETLAGRERVRLAAFFEQLAGLGAAR